MFNTITNLGQWGEKVASQQYINFGYRLINKNYKVYGTKQFGEIDLILIKGERLVFVEVKTRRSNKYGLGADAVSFGKQRKLVKTAKAFLGQYAQYQSYEYRFDVVQIQVDKNGFTVIMLVNVIEDSD